MSARSKLPRLVQVMREGPRPTFQVLPAPAPALRLDYDKNRGWFAQALDLGEDYYLAVIIDANTQDRPEFAHRLVRDQSKRPDAHAVAVSAACHLNEGLGWVFLTLWQGGWPTLQAVYVSDSRHVLCVRSTDESLAPITHPLARGEDYRAMAVAAINAARAGRGAPPVAIEDVRVPPTPADLIPREWLPSLLPKIHSPEKAPPMTAHPQPDPSEQTPPAEIARKLLDLEDLRLWHRRMGELIAARTSAAERVAECRSALKQAQQQERQAESDLDGWMTAQARPLPLSDAPRVEQKPSGEDGPILGVPAASQPDPVSLHVCPRCKGAGFREGLCPACADLPACLRVEWSAAAGRYHLPEPSHRDAALPALAGAPGVGQAGDGWSFPAADLAANLARLCRLGFTIDLVPPADHGGRPAQAVRDARLGGKVAILPAPPGPPELPGHDGEEGYNETPPPGAPTIAAAPPSGEKPPDWWRGEDLAGLRMAPKSVELAYVGDRFFGKKPPKVTPLATDGKLYVTVGMGGQWRWRDAELSPIVPLAEFERDNPGETPCRPPERPPVGYRGAVVLVGRAEHVLLGEGHIRRVRWQDADGRPKQAAPAPAGRTEEASSTTDRPAKLVCEVCGACNGESLFAGSSRCVNCVPFRPVLEHEDATLYRLVAGVHCRFRAWTHPDGRMNVRAARGDLGNWHDDAQESDRRPTREQLLIALAGVAGRPFAPDFAVADLAGGPLVIELHPLAEARLDERIGAVGVDRGAVAGAGEQGPAVADQGRPGAAAGIAAPGSGGAAADPALAAAGAPPASGPGADAAVPGVTGPVSGRGDLVVTAAVPDAAPSERDLGVVEVLPGASGRLLMLPDGEFRLVTLAAHFGDWSRDDLAPDAYRPTLDEIAGACARPGACSRFAPVDHYPQDGPDGELMVFVLAPEVHPEPWRTVRLDGLPERYLACFRRANLLRLGDVAAFLAGGGMLPDLLPQRARAKEAAELLTLLDRAWATQTEEGRRGEPAPWTPRPPLSPDGPCPSCGARSRAYYDGPEGRFCRDCRPDLFGLEPRERFPDTKAGVYNSAELAQIVAEEGAADPDGLGVDHSLAGKVFSTGDVARFCQVAPRTASKWFDSGKLKGHRVPGSNDRRIPRDHLIRFMKDNGIALPPELTEAAVPQPQPKGGELFGPPPTPTAAGGGL